MKRITLLALFAFTFAGSFAQQTWADKREKVANVCPYLQITHFEFTKEYDRSAYRLKQDFGWKNIGEKTIVAFEIIILHFDPFNQSLLGSRGIFPGHNSADFTPLTKDQVDGDGFRSLYDDDVYSAYIYVRNIRFSDNTIWTASPADIIASIKKQTPDILDVGPLAPPKKTGDK